MKKIGQYAWVTACVAGALLLATRPAQAARAVGGLGNHLLFNYWTTESERDTYISIQSPLGVRETNQTRNVVRIIVRGGGDPGFTNTAASTGHNVADPSDPWQYLANNRNTRPQPLVHFDVCLMPGDTWTGTITANAAGDGSILRLGNPGECDATLQQTAGRPTGGGARRTPTSANPIITIDGETTGIVEAYTVASQLLIRDALGNAATSSAVSRPISGIGYLVSPTEGFAAVYEAEAFNNTGCPGTDNNCNTFVLTNDLRADLKRHLIGRWVTDPIINASTDIVLTFPGMHVLNFQTRRTDRDGNTISETQSDPLSLYVFDEEGNVVLTRRDMVLAQSVNICRFEMLENNTTQVTCNDEELGTFSGAVAGSFRIVNNIDKTYGTGNEMTDAGGETPGNPLTVAAQTSGEPLSVTGFVLSFFDVLSGKYDMLVPLRWITLNDPRS